jgi:hypothetical protein
MAFLHPQKTHIFHPFSAPCAIGVSFIFLKKFREFILTRIKNSKNEFSLEEYITTLSIILLIFKDYPSSFYSLLELWHGGIMD